MLNFTWFHQNYLLRNAVFKVVSLTVRKVALQIFLRKFYRRYKILETRVSVSARGLWLLQIALLPITAKIFL